MPPCRSLKCWRDNSSANREFAVTTRDISPLTRLVARIDRTRGSEDPDLIRSGFPSIDRVIGGGFRRGDLIVLGGDDGAGTSALALGIALRCAKRALLCTGEMPVERVYERALAIAARVSLDALRHGVVEDTERTRLSAATVTLRDYAPVVERLTQRGLADVAGALDSLPDASLVIVDGLEALLEHGQQREESLAWIVLTLKRLALERHVALVVVSHLPTLDRQRANRRPRLTDFGVFGAIGTHADVVLGLYREDLYDSDLGVAGATELIVLKQREGPLGYADLYYFAKWLRFEDVLDPDR